ncbi:hypothetical protein PTI98_000736 [Pleurotus ostreatus]|nr:hypothetical protein PTI98_000736 [Pleurotus ostreatus]
MLFLCPFGIWELRGFHSLPIPIPVHFPSHSHSLPIPFPYLLTIPIPIYSPSTLRPLSGIGISAIPYPGIPAFPIPTLAMLAFKYSLRILTFMMIQAQETRRRERYPPGARRRVHRAGVHAARGGLP